ncbi:uncharacterized protein LOC120634760 [Pararge aegeria]|uniref:uncharacterized protein LOC120634760 n=1 Tax=Pararge aegeria TaxID=116150 RepID=UPI0019CFBF53|nr:uncharacterized protein LOC120634760 [Pararge aegeria]
MCDSNVHSSIVQLMRYWYENQKNMLLWGDSVSCEFRLACGVRRAGLTSPDLFNLYVNNLIEELSGTGIGCHIGGVCFNYLSYADDMVLLSPSINGIRKLLHICEEYARNHGLKYNVRKSEMVVFRAGKGPERIPPVLLDGTPVQVVEQFKYLGHMLSGSLSDDLDIERELRSLAIRCNMLARRFARYGSATPKDPLTPSESSTTTRSAFC